MTTTPSKKTTPPSKNTTPPITTSNTSNVTKNPIIARQENVDEFDNILNNLVELPEPSPTLTKLGKQIISPSGNKLDSSALEKLVTKASTVLLPVSSSYKTSGARKTSSRGIGALNENELDEVFAILHNSVKESGIMGVCDHCNIPILIQYCDALGKRYHTEHFQCSKCSKVIIENQYYVTDQSVWCKECFDTLKGGLCGGCNQAITGNFIVALDRKWHPEHFVCTTCKKPFTDGRCFDKDGKPYCETHYREAFLRCKLCNETIVGKAVSMLDSVWHPEHVACKVCMKPYTNGFFSHQGFLYCPMHYQTVVRSQ